MVQDEVHHCSVVLYYPKILNTGVSGKEWLIPKPCINTTAEKQALLFPSIFNGYIGNV